MVFRHFQAMSGVALCMSAVCVLETLVVGVIGLDLSMTCLDLDLGQLGS